MITFAPSLPARKRLLKQVCKKHPQWNARMALSVILFLLAAGIPAGFAGLLIWCHAAPAAIYGFMGAAVCVGCVPFIVGLSVRNTAKFKCGLPYSSYANGTLLLKEDGLEYVFWQVGRGEPAAYSSKHAVYPEESKFVYSIPKSGIGDISIQDNVCTITGKGRIQMPESDFEDDLKEKYCNTFRFLLAFEQSDFSQTIQQWWGYRKNF